MFRISKLHALLHLNGLSSVISCDGEKREHRQGDFKKGWNMLYTNKTVRGHSVGGHISKGALCWRTPKMGHSPARTPVREQFDGNFNLF